MNQQEVMQMVNDVYQAVAVKPDDFIPSEELTTELREMGVDSLDFSIGVMYMADFLDIPNQEINSAWTELERPIQLGDLVSYFVPRATDKTTEQLKDYLCQI